MQINCPNCKKDIQLVGAKELAEDFGLLPNSVQHYRTRGFPEPIMRFGNRYIYLRSDVEEFARNRIKKKLGGSVEALIRDLEKIPPEAQDEIRRQLIDELSPPKPRRKKKEGAGDGS